jgi:hypothetical protein
MKKNRGGGGGRGRGGGGGVKRPSGAPGPLKKLPVFANQVPFRFDPATDAWTEVVLPTPTDGGARKKPGSRPPMPHQPAASTQPSPDHKAEAETEAAETETTPVVEVEVGGGRTYKVCTMNVLFDLYGNERIQTKRRMPALIDLLRDTDADIIGLQVQHRASRGDNHEWCLIVCRVVCVVCVVCGVVSCGGES